MKANLKDFYPAYERADRLDMLSSMKGLSLDACVPFYRNRLFLPMTLSDDFRLPLQHSLQSYERAKSQRFIQYRQQLANECLQAIADRYGEQAYRHLGEWCVASESISDSYDLFDDIQASIRDIESGKISSTIPLALSRFITLLELLDSSLPVLWEEALEPANLKTRWDKAFYAAHYDADPDEERNTWNPSDWISLASAQMCNRLAWGSVFNQADARELSEVTRWVGEMAALRDARVKNPDISILFLTGELRKYYEDGGYFLRDSNN